MKVGREFSFDAAHQLKGYYGKCEKLHGHTYRLQVVVEGPVRENGLVIDFVILKRIVRGKVLDFLDHAFLNEVIENPSAENIAQWIWDQLFPLEDLIRGELNDPNLPQSVGRYLEEGEANDLDRSEGYEGIRLHEVRLWETPRSFVSIVRDDLSID
jgi:6-pyruvoyltetrahydropterin/6-carboxytetrahydropterin synthase